MMRVRYIMVCVMLLAISGATRAQEVKTSPPATLSGARFDESAPQRILPTRYGGRLGNLRKAEQPAFEQPIERVDSAFQSTASASPEFKIPFNYWGGWNGWALHKGLNVQVGASVFAEFGKGAHRGAGFQENISLLYAMPITNKLSLAVGGYLNNINYAGTNLYDAGLSAVLGYRFNEHWEAYIFAQKSLANNAARRMRYSLYDGYYGGFGMGAFGRNALGFSPYSMYDIGNIGDRIGATLRYNFNPSFSMEVTIQKY